MPDIDCTILHRSRIYTSAAAPMSWASVVLLVPLILVLALLLAIETAITLSARSIAALTPLLLR